MLRFPQSLQNAKESDPGHVVNLFYILCGHFDDKRGSTWLQPFFIFFYNFKSPFLKVSAHYKAETYKTCLNCNSSSV